jgi:hypothetical protein
MTAARFFELIVNGKRWNDFEDEWTAAREAARLRSFGWKCYVRDHRKSTHHPPYQHHLFRPLATEAMQAAQHPDASTPDHEGNAMKASKYYAAEPIKLETFDDAKEITGTITAATSKRFDDRERIVLTLNEDEYSLIVNDTAYRVLKKGYGEETDDWIGLPLTVYKGPVRYKGEMQDGICVRIPEGAERPAAPAKTAAANDDRGTLSDDIPF